MILSNFVYPSPSYDIYSINQSSGDFKLGQTQVRRPAVQLGQTSVQLGLSFRIDMFFKLDICMSKLDRRMSTMDTRLSKLEVTRA